MASGDGADSRKRATMTVTGLLGPDESGGLSVEDGLVCTGRDREEEIEIPLCDIEVKKKEPNFKLVSDYAYWFDNWPCRDGGEIGRGRRRSGGSNPEISRLTRAVPGTAVLILGVGVCLLGATFGAALGTLNGAATAALIGSVPLGMTGAFLLGRYGRAVGAVYQLRYETVLGVIFGLVGGGLVGVIAGFRAGRPCGASWASSPGCSLGPTWYRKDGGG